MPYGLKQEVFKGFPYIKLCKTKSGPQGYNLNNLGKSPLDEVTYQISKTWAIWFQSKRFLKVLPMLVYVKHVGPRAGPFVAQGLQLKQSW